LPRSEFCVIICFEVATQQRLYMLYCSLLKVIFPEYPRGVPPFLLFRGLCL
jgi:hypothetical protein